MENMILSRLNVLGHPGRMAVFRLLMRRLPDAVPAGEIGRALDIKPSTLSVYLSALSTAGLVGQRRMSTSLLYSARPQAAGEIVDFLFNDCCRGRPETCASFAVPRQEGLPDMSDRKYNVLFICTGNSARSVFAETILRREAEDRFNVYSAGTRPHSELNPFALQVLRAKGHDTSGLRAKHISEFTGPDAPQMDFVFTVCDQAANEDCPAWEGQPISAHWGMPDPVRATGSQAQKSLAFQQAYGALRNRILAFAALPLAGLDRLSLQRAVDDIASQHQEETT
ncbi:helix-turn-helix domain-containing protein [Roseovarius sp.]|uniref:arsenate reductase/protein-tyrosine-phosphatase family protein n=1 Tax=Roseovarius sp. TaxID=1486281 RepID=UPI002635445B|nr:helix-turn-helix domain-containing protein [Roseovarius sp.]